jgi:Zn ribbon nucleic-acid-binding protein
MTTIGSHGHAAKCAQCGAKLVFPEWSERTSELESTNIWHCVVCGCEFETKDNIIEQQPSDTELVQEFLPNLLVA